MNVKPVRQRSVLVRLAKIHKAQKRAAKAAAAEAKAAARAAQGTDEFVKTGFKAKMKTPKFRNWAIGVAAALGAAGAITVGAIFSRPKTYDAALEARMRAYAEYRGDSQSEVDNFSRFSPSRNILLEEVWAADQQKSLDERAFQDILKDHGYDIDDRLYSNITPYLVGLDRHNNSVQKLIDTKLDYLKENMTAKEYQKFVKNMETVDYNEYVRRSYYKPYYRNTLGQYTADSIAFRKYLEKTGTINDRGVMKDFHKICNVIRPDFEDYNRVYIAEEYKPFKFHKGEELANRKELLLDIQRDKY